MIEFCCYLKDQHADEDITNVQMELNASMLINFAIETNTAGKHEIMRLQI